MFLKMSLLLNCVLAMGAPTALANATTQEVEQAKWNCGGENTLKSEPQRSIVLWEEEKFWKEHVRDTWENVFYHKIGISHFGINKMVEHLENGRAGSLIISLIYFQPYIQAKVIPHLVFSAYRWRELDKGYGIFVKYLFGLFETESWARGRLVDERYDSALLS